MKASGRSQFLIHQLKRKYSKGYEAEAAKCMAQLANEHLNELQATLAKLAKVGTFANEEGGSKEVV